MILDIKTLRSHKKYAPKDHERTSLRASFTFLELDLKPLVTDLVQ